MNRHEVSPLPRSIQDDLDVVWYQRDKSDLPGPPLFWRAIWPEGGKLQQGRINFIAMVYLTAPTKAAALREFQRWACLRLQDIPYVVLEEVAPSEVPSCLHPCCEHNGETTGCWSQLT